MAKVKKVVEQSPEDEVISIVKTIEIKTQIIAELTKEIKEYKERLKELK